MCQFGIVTYASSVGVNLSLPAVQIYRVSRRTVTCALVIGIAIGVSLESSPMHLITNCPESDTHTPKNLTPSPCSLSVPFSQTPSPIKDIPYYLRNEVRGRS